MRSRWGANIQHRLALVQHGVGDVGQDPCAHPLGTKLAQAARGDAHITDEEGGAPFRVSWQATQREDDLPHVLNQRRIVVQQNAAHQNGVLAVHCQRKMGCRGDCQPARFRGSAAFRSARRHDAGLLWKPGRKRRQLVCCEKLVGRARHPHHGLGDGIRVRQAGAWHHPGAGGNDRAVCICDDEKVESAGLRRGLQNVVQFLAASP